MNSFSFRRPARPAIFALAVVVALGLAVGVTTAKVKRVKVDSEVTLDDDRGADWTGHVLASKPKCTRRRHVSITYQSMDGPVSKGDDMTDNNGGWAIDLKGGATPGDYEIRADRRKIRKKRHGELVKKIICKADTLAFERKPS